MSQKDYGMIMHILEGNLTEGQKKTAVDVKASKVESTTFNKPSHLSLPSIPSLNELEEPAKTETKVTTFLKFTFSMDSFIVNLYICNENEVS